jgi:very-short-patch-repair endonuclease
MLDELCRLQEGVVTLQQATDAGLSRGAVRARIDSGRWRRLHDGVYATFSGPMPRSAQLWAVLLTCGAGAVLSHETAGELVGLVDEPGSAVHVCIPSTRRVRSIPGVVRHVSRRAGVARHPTRLPPQTRVEETVVDLTQSARDLDSAVNWVVRACARRLTTVDRLRAAMSARPRLRWRADLLAVLGDVSEGCHSVLELRYLRDVERAHRLPPAQRQVIRARRGGRWYDDVLYHRYRTVVELDGDQAHPAEVRVRDMVRDNAGVAEGLSMLRYGRAHVVSRPCAIAAQVGGVLRANGWRDYPRPCGPACMIANS